MIEPAWQSSGGRHRVYLGDCVDLMRQMPERSVRCCVTSPPYWGLRDYQADGQIGLEPTPDEYVAKMVEVFREVRRVLADDGTLWLNLGDSYFTKVYTNRNNATGGLGGDEIRGGGHLSVKRAECGLKDKDLCGIPWRVAFALQADGWYLRQDIIWAKPNPMPESVRDRCTKAHEYIFLLSKGSRYYYDAEAIAEPWTCDRDDMRSKGVRTGLAYLGGAHNNSVKDGRSGDGQRTQGETPQSRNRRSVWTVATHAYPESHFATFPPKLIEPCILAGTSDRGGCPKCGAAWVRDVERVRTPSGCSTRAAVGCTDRNDADYPRMDVTTRTTGWSPSCTCNAGDPVPDTVLDPFTGSGTTGAVAAKHGRRFVGCELNPDYIALAGRRIDEEADHLFAGVDARC